MASRNEIITYIDRLLCPENFNDYAPNGLQVEGSPTITKILSAVTASQNAIEAAIDAKAEAILVHHGYFWKGEPAQVVGIKKARLKHLLIHEINLIAYHLPLDAHEEVGNNVQLAQRLGFSIETTFGPGRVPLAMVGRTSQSLSGAELAKRIAQQLGRAPLHIDAKDRIIDRVAWCTGGAQSYIDLAVSQDVDAFVSGEISEQTVHVAREAGIHYFAAGHHATERYGVQALGQRIANEFGIEHIFFDDDNPV